MNITSLTAGMRKLGAALLALAITFALSGFSYATPVAAGIAADVTTSTQINTLWKKVQGKLVEGYNFLCEEWEEMDELKKYDVDYSTREITTPIRLRRVGGVASIAEGGYEAFPSSTKPEEATFSFVQINARWSASGLTRMIEQNNGSAQITSQLAYQAREKLDAFAAWYADSFYGSSTAVRATLSGTYTANASQTLTLTNGHGLTSITNTAYIAQLFTEGDRIALVRAGALVGNTTGLITSNPGNGTLAVTFGAAVTPAAGDQVVLANAMYDAAPTLAETDWNKGIVGLTDAALSTSVHGLSSATRPEWKASLNDSAGGRFTGTRYQKGRDEISNKGGGKLNRLYLSQGVYRDMVENYRGSVRFTDTFAMEMDGSVKIEGVEFKKTRRVPPGFAIGMDKSAYRKFPNLIAKPGGTPKFNEAEKFVDRDAWKFRIDFVTANCVLNRANLAIWTGLTEL